MSRLHKKLMIVFCIGVFLCGIGGGVAFTEFSALTYDGQKILGNADVRTQDFDVEFEPGEEKQEITGGGLYVHGPGVIHTDASVPQNTVRFRVTYNADRIEPYALWYDERGQIIFSWIYDDTYDEMALMMEAKDLLLQNLKEGKIVSFDSPLLESVAIMVNPVNLDDVEIVY